MPTFIAMGQLLANVRIYCLRLFVVVCEPLLLMLCGGTCIAYVYILALILTNANIKMSYGYIARGYFLLFINLLCLCGVADFILHMCMVICANISYVVADPFSKFIITNPCL